jgi:hypothetical protein
VSLEAGKERLLETGGVPVVEEKLVVIHPSPPILLPPVKLSES